jgi:hypothetical protein
MASGQVNKEQFKNVPGVLGTSPAPSPVPIPNARVGLSPLAIDAFVSGSMNAPHVFTIAGALPNSSEPYANLYSAINESRAILEQDDSDPDAPMRPSLATWQRATDFLAKVARFSLARLGYTMRIPLISVADEGSVDLFWKTQGGTLLMNFPSDPCEQATYYGENAAGETISGSVVGVEGGPLLATWLIQAG